MSSTSAGATKLESDTGPEEMSERRAEPCKPTFEQEASMDHDSDKRAGENYSDKSSNGSEEATLTNDEDEGKEEEDRPDSADGTEPATLTQDESVQQTNSNYDSRSEDGSGSVSEEDFGSDYPSDASEAYEYDIDYGSDAKLKGQISSCLHGVRAAGWFMTGSDIRDNVNPGISLDPVGLVRIPLSQEDAQKLVEMSQLAPFGTATATHVDVAIRRTWEIDGSKIEFLNPKWESDLEGIVDQACTDLGIEKGSQDVSAQLHKMLLYEEGAMFKPHQDTEKVKGMFATLVICLPSEHQGGGLALHHNGQCETYDTDINSSFGMSYIAWYSDVIHEIKPVRSGLRWVLTYNLISTATTPYGYSASALDIHTNEFVRILNRWQSQSSSPNALAYPLAHQYTTYGLRLSHLKGEDLPRVNYVNDACERQSEFFVFLADLQLCYTDVQNEGEGNTRVLTLQRIVDMDGFDILGEYTVLPIDRRLIIPRGSRPFYRGRDPDKQEGGGYMGNQQCEITQLYRDSVVLLIPKPRLMSVFLGSSLGPKFLRELLSRLDSYRRTSEDGLSSEDFRRNICECVLSMESYGDKPRNHWLGAVAVAAIQMQDTLLFKRIVDQIQGCLADVDATRLGELMWVINDNRDLNLSLGTALTRSGKLSEIYDNVLNFRIGYHRNPKSSHDNRVSTDDWLDDLILKSFAKLTGTDAEDAHDLVNIIVRSASGSPKQKASFQCARSVIDKSLTDKVFTTFMTLELLVHLPTSGSASEYLSILLRHILDGFIVDFELKRYISCVQSATCCAPQNWDYCKDAWSGKGGIGPIQSLIQNLGASNQINLMYRIRTQTSHIVGYSRREYLWRILEETIPGLDLTSRQVQEHFRDLTSACIVEIVGREPLKPEPEDWSRPDEKASDPIYRCRDDAERINNFLEDAKGKSLTVSHKTRCDVSYSFNSLAFFEVEDVDKETVRLTKTTKHWQKQHHKWEERAADAVAKLKGLPEDLLRRCLGTEYEGIMDLRMVKLATPKIGKMTELSSTVGSTVPTKRCRSP